MNFLQSLIPEGSLNQEKTNLFQQHFSAYFFRSES